ncbi:unnamed protein product [Ceratitis capitata]|uniref:(Mediterranean fruit fly) hypothetical protein n=1 Tax=Ceratitis capitata TaxID=7213 RepID=A0A811V7N4_CERCA|nr:unnamed protein product [Ceratitis capitata]
MRPGGTLIPSMCEHKDQMRLCHVDGRLSYIMEHMQSVLMRAQAKSQRMLTSIQSTGKNGSE